jgi:hypothetical protein
MFVFTLELVKTSARFLTAFEKSVAGGADDAAFVWSL